MKEEIKKENENGCEIKYIKDWQTNRKCNTCRKEITNEQYYLYLLGDDR